MIHNHLNGSTRYIEKGKPFQIKDFRITAFDVPHDSNDNSGYFFEFGRQRMTLATDVGAITDEVAYYVCKANQLVIESNYDEEMFAQRSLSLVPETKNHLWNGTPEQPADGGVPGKQLLF